ncbi:MAG: TraR/DksA family transcriptional regulator [Planctomycetaceae bacterium]
MARKEALLKLRKTLVRRREALARALEGDLSLLRELHAAASGDVLDAACDTAQDEINSQLVDVESRELSAIDAAIVRMDEGNFGDCETCGKPIPLQRLQAVPYVTDCIGCRRRVEDSADAGPRQWNRVFDNVEADRV